MTKLQNLELNFLQKNHTWAETEDYSKSIKDYTLEDWNNNVASISFGPDSKLSKQTIKSVILNLKSLKELDLKSDDCQYDISFEEYEVLVDDGIDVVLNTDKVYSDSRVNKAARIKEYIKLMDSKSELQEQIVKIQERLIKLGFV